MVADKGVKILSNIHLNRPPSAEICAPHCTGTTNLSKPFPITASLAVSSE